MAHVAGEASLTFRHYASYILDSRNTSHHRTLLIYIYIYIYIVNNILNDFL
jgi:hypothetical protein